MSGYYGKTDDLWLMMDDLHGAGDLLRQS